MLKGNIEKVCGNVYKGALGVALVVVDGVCDSPSQVTSA